MSASTGEERESGQPVKDCRPGAPAQSGGGRAHGRARCAEVAGRTGEGGDRREKTWRGALLVRVRGRMQAAA
eukprot:2118851-Prymnesium_polylepis.1